ncbi:MAG: SDR family oxidoreductase [Chitinophagaceae bacterium]|nr:SDR family oxidoreductase [Chitinophagaceae bacterium]MCA6459675.1 SDR family oxidoreductase [Chitinophagaceae bacterium]MCA6464542.1 SDR family oxidoreductase [Chitinophagaceae bacterium]
MKLDFAGKTILITGATRGIGKQIAEDLLGLGADLLLTGTNKEQIEDLNLESEKKGLSQKYFCVDLTQESSLSEFIDQIKDIEQIHGLVNNAGINKLNSIQNALDHDWDQMLQVNLSSPFRLIKAVSAKMINQQYGRIVNIGSIFSKISKERRSVYSATKFGLDGLTVGASNDLAQYNILVNTLSPGFVLTDLTRKNLSESEMKELAEKVPAKRLAQVSDISNVAVFLLSSFNQYLTGQNIVVDGGFTNI